MIEREGMKCSKAKIDSQATHFRLDDRTSTRKLLAGIYWLHSNLRNSSDQIELTSLSQLTIRTTGNFF